MQTSSRSNHFTACNHHQLWLVGKTTIYRATTDCWDPLKQLASTTTRRSRREKMYSNIPECECDDDGPYVCRFVYKLEAWKVNRWPNQTAARRRRLSRGSEREWWWVARCAVATCRCFQFFLNTQIVAIHIFHHGMHSGLCKTRQFFTGDLEPRRLTKRFPSES